MFILKKKFDLEYDISYTRFLSLIVSGSAGHLFCSYSTQPLYELKSCQSTDLSVWGVAVF